MQVVNLPKKLNFVIVGIGPHSKRTYLRFFLKYKIYPKLIIELESEKDNVSSLILEKRWDAILFTIPDEYKNALVLPKNYQSQLDIICKEKEITHAIIATEPKGHLMYCDYFLSKNIHTLIDKPLVVFDNMLDVVNIEKIRESFYRLSQSRNENTIFKVLCQRNFHKGYEYIRNLIKQTIEEYNIPITYLSIYGCDGNWVMPHDLDYENHPYKYGYGKTFHSGYHYIDLLISLLKLNNYTTDEKRIVKAKMYNSFVTPTDELDIINLSDYKNFFSNEKFPSFYDKQDFNFANYGEKDIFSQIEFTNLKNRIITITNLNILESGFSRRGWLHTKEDRYKGNGRVRHESLNIQLGPLLNIQIHSYQSKEIKDRSANEFDFGGLDHFDIDIYRNTELIGGQPFERIRTTDLYDFSKENYFKGLIEMGREDSIKSFISLKEDENDLINQKDSMELLYQCCMSYYCYKNNKDRIREFSFNLMDGV